MFSGSINSSTFMLVIGIRKKICDTNPVSGGGKKGK